MSLSNNLYCSHNIHSSAFPLEFLGRQYNAGVRSVLIA
jgi:hypothetical protein